MTYASHSGSQTSPKCTYAICRNRLPCAVEESRVCSSGSGLNPRLEDLQEFLSLKSLKMLLFEGTYIRWDSY